MKKNYTMTMAVPVQKTIDKLNEAWSIKFCNVTLGNFCSQVCKGRYCGTCDSCPVNQAYQLAIQQIRDGVRSSLNMLIAPSPVMVLTAILTAKVTKRRCGEHL